MNFEQKMDWLTVALEANTTAAQQLTKALNNYAKHTGAVESEATADTSVTAKLDKIEKKLKSVKKEEAPKLDYEIHVKPRVIGYVKTKGRPAVNEVLASYDGAKIASQVPEKKWSEMLDALDNLPDLNAEEEAA